MQRSLIERFLADETGAITIDWTALTSGILLLGIAVVWSIFSSGVDPLVGSINSKLSSVAIFEPGVPSFTSLGLGLGWVSPFPDDVPFDETTIVLTQGTGTVTIVGEDGTVTSYTSAQYNGLKGNGDKIDIVDDDGNVISGGFETLISYNSGTGEWSEELI